LAFFIGCRRDAQAIDFLTCHFCRFRSSPSTRSPALADPKSQLDKPADRFGARWIVLL
jgi:hypothetical protein